MRKWCLLLLLCLTSYASGADVDTLRMNGKRYRVVHADLKNEDVRVFWADVHGKPFRTLPALRAALGATLLAAVNAGMYERGRTRPPLGLLIANGDRVRDINLQDGSGNFYKKPNGVFYIVGERAGIIESSVFSTRFPAGTNDVTDATQSGPLLLTDGRPRLGLPREANTRSSVCLASPTDVFLVLSEDEVSFDELTMMMRNELRCRDALYLDGAVSNIDWRERPSRAKKDRYAGLIGVVMRAHQQ
jgi:uncharacterized protein YigE (DUF2233 family)